MSDRDLDRLASQLARCLGRLDDQAARILGDPGALEPELLDLLDSETARLQQLLDSLAARVQETGQQGADLDHLVSRAVGWLLGEAGFPLVVRERLAGGLPPVDAPPAEVEQVVRRCLILAAAHAGRGGEILVATRGGAEEVVFELRCRGQGDAHLQQRAATLHEFVTAMRGQSRLVVDDAGDLQVMVGLPAVLEPDGR